ncbi:hypothetical protein L1987_87203 [Smallanthus sonchifolius]|nr:hypothetical protein L1987_87203 [Smallanthus sonchifolius]
MATEKSDVTTSMEVDDQIGTNAKFSINGLIEAIKILADAAWITFWGLHSLSVMLDLCVDSRRYCSARLRRLYKSLKFTHGRGRYTKKSITLPTVTEVRFLHLVLYTAERAWSHAMEKRQLPDGPNARQRSYLIGRLRKAVKWATLFAELCAIKGDSRTSLEAEAYASYMKGNLLFEQDQNWDIALKSFKSARQAVMAEARSQQAASMTEFHWLGHRFHISNAKTRVSILKAQELEKELHDRIEGALPAEKRLPVFDKIFAAYNEARASIRNDLATAGNSENIKDDLSGLDKAIGAVLGQRTIQRNQLLVSIAKSKLCKARDEKNEEVTKPEELVRLYDLLLQNTSDLSDLLSSGRDRKEEEVALSQECEFKSLIFRAERCFFLAKSYSSAGKRTEAYSLFSLAHSLAADALKKLRSVTNHDQVMTKEVETLYNSCRSNSCIEHAMGIMENEKVPEDLSKKISNVSISRSDKKVAPRIAAYQPGFQAIARNPIVLDLAYNSIDFPSIESRLKKDKKGFISRLWG